MSDFYYSPEGRAFRIKHAEDVSYTIPDGAIIGAGYFCDLRRLRTIHIERDFDYDEYLSAKYDHHNIIRRFVVDDFWSPFFTIDGVLFMYITTSPGRMLPSGGSAVIAYAMYPSGWLEEKKMLGSMSFPNGMFGKVLVAFPPAYPGKEYYIPEGTVAVLPFAFTGCHLKRIFFPESIQRVGFHALDGARHLKEAVFQSDDVRIAEQYFDNEHRDCKFVFLHHIEKPTNAFPEEPKERKQDKTELAKDLTGQRLEKMTEKHPEVGKLVSRLGLDVVGTIGLTANAAETSNVENNKD